MPLNTTGRYTWTRSQLRTYRPSRFRATLLIVAAWVVIGSSYAALLRCVVTGGN